MIQIKHDLNFSLHLPYALIDKDFIQRALVPIGGLCATGAAAQLGYLPAWMQTQPESLTPCELRAACITWAEMLQHSILLFSAIFHRHKHQTKQKGKTKQTNLKSPNMNITACIFHLGCLDATASRASRQSGREHVQRETEGKQITQRGNKNTNQNV